MSDRNWVCLTIALVFAISSVAAEVQPATDAPQPLTPEQSQAKMRLPDGFRIELVASEPIVEEPSCIAFDEAGRLFVCELHGYNVEGEIDVAELNKTGELDKQVRRIRWEKQGGKIAEEAAKRQYGVLKMLVDTDDDGVMDEALIWADDLPPCYGIVPALGGIIVVCAPNIMFFADRTGDGRPNVRYPLFSGFRTDVMERGINNPRWSFDNWIYVGAGGSGGTITGPHLDKPVDLPHSDFRIKPDGSAIEPVNGRVGTFGLTINDVGDRFPSSGGQPATYALPLPYHYLARNPFVPTPSTNHSAASYNRGYRISDPHPWRVRRRQDPAWIKFYGDRETNSNYFSGGCSNEYYGDRLFPEQYRGDLFYCEPSLNIIHRCNLRRDGAGYRAERAASEQESEFLASTDQWFRPMNLRVGPEGALYIVDMYREIIEDYSAIPRFLQQQYGLDKGRRHGRIWRLLPKDASIKKIKDLSKLSTSELVRLTSDTNAWNRLTSQRLLLERFEKSAAPALSEQFRARTIPPGKIAALYTLAGLGKLSAGDLHHALADEHFAVRLHGLRLCDRWLDQDPLLLSLAMGMVEDADPSVRLQLALTLGQSEKPIAIEGLLKLARQSGQERWMEAAIVSSARGKSLAILLELLQSPEKESLGLLRPLCATLAGERDPQSISRVLTMAASADADQQVACLAGFADVLTSGDVPVLESADGWASLATLLNSNSQPVRDLATKLAVPLKPADSDQLRAIFAGAVKRATDQQLALEKREQAILVLSSAPFEVLQAVTQKLLNTKEPAAVQLAAIEALSASAEPAAGKRLLANWKSYTPAIRKTVMQATFARTNRLSILLDAIEQGDIQRNELTASQREQLITSGDDSVASRAKELLANPAASAERQQRINAYNQALAKDRNLDRGREVFRKHCLACHKTGGEGYEVGPKLGSIINKPDEMILLDLLDPSGKIDPEYRSYIVATNDGRTFTGLLVSESPTSITLQNEKNVTESILRTEIDVIKASEVSLMPSNLHQQIGPQAAADLIGYMRDVFSK